MAAVAQPSGLLEQLLGGAADAEGEVSGPLIGPLIAPASGLRQTLTRACLPAQGLTSGALQEALSKVDVRREEVRRPTCPAA